MIKLRKLLYESWKNYVVSTNPEVLLYDFYVLSYLTTLPISPEQKGFAGSLIGRDPSEIKQDIDEAESKLLPVLRDKLREALFVAICAEVRHVFDRIQKWDDLVENNLFKQYYRNYRLMSSDKDVFAPTRNIDNPNVTPKSSEYLQSFRAATKAINDSGNNRTNFALLCAYLFRNKSWDNQYGGERWAEIAEAYASLSKHPQSKQQLQVAIDHAYDLQHNTGTVLNKVKEYYIKGDITWLKRALDFKANLRSLYELLPKCSSDMRKLALESFKTAGIKRPSLETVVPGEYVINVKKDVDPNLDLGRNTEMYQKLIRRNINKKLTFKDENNHFEGIIQDNIGLSNNYYVKITKILNGKLFIFGTLSVGQIVAINPLNSNIKIEKDTKKESLNDDDINKLKELSLIELDSKVIEKLKKNKVFNRYTKHMDDHLKDTLIIELTKTVVNAFMMYIGDIFFEKSKVNVEIQKDPRAVAVLQRFKNTYITVKIRSAFHKQSIFNLTIFIRKMIISGKMEELTKTLIEELVNEYIEVIEKLAIVVEPPIKIPDDIKPTSYVINYKRLLPKDTNL